MKRWEYLILPFEDGLLDTEKELDRLGRDGWEVCASHSYTYEQPGKGYDVRVTVYTLKRPI